MANTEETANEYDVVREPEENRERLNPMSCDSSDTDKVEESNADSTSSDAKIPEKKANVRDSHPTVETLCPRINCPEKILFCIDCSSELNVTYFRSRVGDKLSAFREMIKALRMFILNKNRINASHQFGLAVFTDKVVWMKSFCKPREIIKVLDNLSASLPAGDFDLDSLFQFLKEHLTLPEVTDVHVVPPPYVIRVLFIYGRSHCVPLFTDKLIHHDLEMSPYFFLDALYIHEQPSEENNCEDIFTRLCELDHKGFSYILEASSLTGLFDCVAMLLPHPLQRPMQRQANYHIGCPSNLEGQTV